MASDAQVQLKEYCQSINDRGELVTDDVQWLIRWLKENSQLSTPAVNNLRDIVRRTAADKKITAEEKQEILSSVKEVAADWELDLSSNQGFDDEYRLADEGYGLAYEVELGSSAVADEPTTACPECGTEIAGSAVVCIKCGYDRRQGEQRETVRSQFVEVGNLKFEVDRRDGGTLTVTHMRFSILGMAVILGLLSAFGGIAKLLSPEGPFLWVFVVFALFVVVAMAMLPRFGGTVLLRHSFQQKNPTLAKWGPYFFAQDKRSYRIQDFHSYDVRHEYTEDEETHERRERYVLRISGGFFRNLRYEFTDRYEAYSVLNLIRSVAE